MNRMRRHTPRAALLAACAVACLAGCGTKSSSVTLPAFGGETPASAAPQASATPAAPLLLLQTPSPSANIPTGSPTATPRPATPKPSVSTSPIPGKTAPSPTPTPSASPTASPSPAGPSAVDIVNAAMQQFNAITTYKATLDTYEVGPEKTLKATVTAYFRKPNTFRLEVVSSTDPTAQGATMIYTGGSTVQVKKSIFTLTLQLTDSRLLSPRGDRLDQADVLSILKQFSEPGAQVSYAGASELDGRKLHVLKLVTPGMAGRNVAHAHIGFDVEGKYLALREEYDPNNRLTLRMTIRNVQLDPSLAASLFSF